MWLNSTLKLKITMSTATSLDEGYLDIELDAETHEKVQRLAEESGVSAFEMCVSLLEERLAARDKRSLLE
jgi:hypothetical protein